MEFHVPRTNMCLRTIMLIGAFCVTVLFGVSSCVPWGQCDSLVLKDGLHLLNCSGKDLIQLPDDLQEAEVMDMSHNRFTELPQIPEYPECQLDHGDRRCHVVNSSNICRYKVSFSGNEIYKFNPEALHSLMCLNTLDLSYNDITHEILHPHTFMEGVYNLQTLILRGNPLGHLPDNVLPSPFMVDLRELDLSHCELKDIGKDSVDDHSKLQVLNLAYNKLTTIHPETFKGLFSLKLLDLRENRLNYLPARVFGDLSALTTLHLANNRIQAFSSDAFFSDSSLSNLDLSFNEFNKIPYEAVDKLPQLKSLDLSYNPIDAVESGRGKSSVTTLTLDGLSLTSMGPDALGSFPNLVNLSLSGCRKLSSIDPHVLGTKGSYPALKRVSLTHSGLRTLDTTTFPWTHLVTFDLRDNPWACDSRLTWMMQARDVIKVSPVCKDPLKLQGRLLFELQPHQLSRYVDPSMMAGLVVFLVALPVTVALGYLLWRRRRLLVCVRTKIRGRYVSVYTRDVDGEDNDQVDIELKVNVNRLSAVSNGSADDTKPFIAVRGGEERDDEEDIF